MTAKKRGHARLVPLKDHEGKTVLCVDTGVGGYKQIETSEGPATATTQVRTSIGKAKVSHRYSALGRARRG